MPFTVQKTYQNGLLLLKKNKATYVYCRLHVGTSTICQRSFKSSLPSLYPLHYSFEKLFQALYRFSILQATESWAGPGNKANDQLCDANCVVWMSLNLIPKPHTGLCIYDMNTKYMCFNVILDHFLFVFLVCLFFSRLTTIQVEKKTVSGMQVDKSACPAMKSLS